ncbi:MAG: serine/threonine-protein kinase [Myxococcota bacterium]
MGSRSPTDDDETRTSSRVGAGHETPELDGPTPRWQRVVPATNIGRFSVLELIGAGGMGRVYAAYDRVLDRRVALKVLHATDDERMRVRFSREAQSLAKLAHPNIVAIHDVGAHDGELFIAMEFIEGQTLLDWAVANPPGSSERLEEALQLLVDAGRGLEAAHRAGLMHRDVKPRNIVVGEDGRVRVVDFGLARSGGGESAGDGPNGDTGDTEQGDAPPWSGSVTQTGHAVGTPAYMAPEQFRSEETDGLTDQFGFCVTAWETLFAVRPFIDGTQDNPLTAIRKGEPRRPSEVVVPAALESALRKGMSWSPRKRHRDMAALLEVLEETLAALRGQARPRYFSGRIGLVATLGLAAVSSIAFWLGSGDDPPCEVTEEQFAGVWDEERKSELRAAIDGVPLSLAGDTWARLERNVDGYTQEWSEGRRETCEATWVRNEQSSELLDLRMGCLRSRRQHLVAYLDLLSAPTPEIVARADQGFAALPPIDRCADADYVRSGYPIPKDPEAAAKAEVMSEMLAGAHARHTAGDLKGSLAIAHDVVKEADESTFPVIRARAEHRVGAAYLALAKPDQAIEFLERAHFLSRVADETSISSRTAGMLVEAERDWKRSGLWLEVAKAEAKRTGDPRRIAAANIRVGTALANEARWEASRAALEEGLDVLLSLEHAPPEPIIWGLRVMARVHAESGELALSAATLKEVEERARKVLGPAHPEFNRIRMARVQLLLREGVDDGRGARALEIAREVVGRAESLHPPGSLALARPLLTEAEVLFLLGRDTEALPILQRVRKLGGGEGLRMTDYAESLRIEAHYWSIQGKPAEAEALWAEAVSLYEQRRGPDDLVSIEYRLVWALELHALGRLDQARAVAAPALVAIDTLPNPEHPSVVTSYFYASEMARLDGQIERAAELLERALSVSEKFFGPDNAETVKVGTSLCTILGAQQRFDEAVSVCRHAVEATATSADLTPAEKGLLHLNLGAALFWQKRLDEARESYEQALERLSESLGAESFYVSIALANIAEVDLRQGQWRPAEQRYRRALAIREKTRGVTHPALGVPLLGLAEALLGLGQYDEAATHVDRAHDIAVGSEGAESQSAAKAMMMRARVLAGLPRHNRARVERIARRALALFEAEGATAKTEADAARTWLEAHSTAMP